MNAYFLGRRGNALLRKAIEFDPKLYDAYMGLGIYDYFTDTLPGVQGVLAALLIHGDKHRGLKELQWAIDKGNHARIEAMMFLIEIYTSEENTPDKALPLAEALRKEFPQSYVMHLTEATVLYQMKKWPEMVKEAQSLLEKSQSGVPYYSSEGVRPARYLLGLGALYGRHDLTLANAYMNQLAAERTIPAAGSAMPTCAADKSRTCAENAKRPRGTTAQSYRETISGAHTKKRKPTSANLLSFRTKALNKSNDAAFVERAILRGFRP